MERQRTADTTGPQLSTDGPAGDGNLDQVRAEMDEVLEAADRAFDAINNLHAQQYLQQNLQTGGQ